MGACREGGIHQDPYREAHLEEEDHPFQDQVGKGAHLEDPSCQEGEGMVAAQREADRQEIPSEDHQMLEEEVPSAADQSQTHLVADPHLSHTRQ